MTFGNFNKPIERGMTFGNLETQENPVVDESSTNVFE